MTTDWRNTLARELTRRFRMSAKEAMRAPVRLTGAAARTAITGPPGAGKSSLIAHLAKHWLDCGLRIGVLAIDPTSPVSGGSLLGDRLRMDELLGTNSEIYIRSFPTHASTDGLCPNILALLEAYEECGFDELIMETVGIGQVSYEARLLVDTFVLVLNPESGDIIQAMKAGIVELADIYVVNKADLPGSTRLVKELRSLLKWRSAEGRKPEVIMVSSFDGRGMTELARAIATHRTSRSGDPDRSAVELARRDYLLKSLVQRRTLEILASGAVPGSASIADAVRRIATSLLDS
jgi:LAO/AO transport system kinase